MIHTFAICSQKSSLQIIYFKKRVIPNVTNGLACLPIDKLWLNWTRTTRMPAFWGYPLPPHDYPYYWVILDPNSKEDKVKVTYLNNLPKLQNLKQTLHATNLLKLLHNMWKYEMDPMSIGEDTERIRFCPETDRRTSVLHIWYKYQVKLDAPHSASTYLCSHFLAVIFLDQ